MFFESFTSRLRKVYLFDCLLLSKSELKYRRMQFVCEDRLHKSQVGAVGSSLGSYPRGRQFESGTLQHSFLGDKN